LPIRPYTVALFVVLTCLPARSLWAEIYIWVDRDGQTHFTDNQALVPPEYRDRTQVRPSSPASEVLPQTTPSAPMKQGKKPSASRAGRSSAGGTARVIAVLDGDTIVVGGGEKVRYAGLNTPETHHPEKLPEYCGREAFEANRRLVAGKTVRLEYDERRRDKYGRLLAYVYVDGLFVNAELIRQGYAQVSTYKDAQRHHETFVRLQRQAIAARRGLWGGCTDVIPPGPSTPSAPYAPSPAGRRRG
jgi:micrococcal nuclease